MEEGFDSSKRTASCVTMSAFRNALRRSLLPSKRHTAIFCYNSPSWRQPQQLRQRLIPLRRIKSSGAFGRSAHMASGPPYARHAVVLAYASTASSAPNVRPAVAQAFASMASGAKTAGDVGAQIFASTASYATIARPAAVVASASTASGATVAPSVRTYRAPWKAAHSSATVSVQPESY